MKQSRSIVIFLCAALLLAACAGPVTAGEATDIAVEHLRTEFEGVTFRAEEAECEYREFEELCCYLVDIPGGDHIYRVSVDADSGEVIDAARCK